MKRIIQRCFLVLTFTGILLSYAQETTLFDESEQTLKSSEQTSPSALERSFTSVGTPTADGVAYGDSSQSDATSAATGRLVTEKDVTERNSQTLFANEAGEEESTTVVSGTEKKSHGDGAENSKNMHSSSSKSTTGPSLAQSEGLYKENLMDSDSDAAKEISSEKLPSSSSYKNAGETSTEQAFGESYLENDTEHNSDTKHVKDTDASTRILVTTEISESGKTSPGVTSSLSTETNSSEINSSSVNSDQSTVPSKEDSISSSSTAEENHITAEKISSTAPSKVQTVDTDSAKSATRKRSLNATNILSGGTTVVSENQTSAALDISSPTVQPPDANEAKSGENVTGDDETTKDIQYPWLSPFENKSIDFDAAKVEDVETFSSRKDTVSAQVTGSHLKILSTHEIFYASPLLPVEEELGVSEPSSRSSPPDSGLLTSSSAALSSFREESIHPSESLGSSNPPTYSEYITPTPEDERRPSELEVEDFFPIRHSEHSPRAATSSVTFDPNGMTHEFSQDPDSVTFSPEVFHVDGMPTDEYLSRLEVGDSSSTNPKPVPDFSKLPEGTTPAHEELLETSSKDSKNVYSSEREREAVSPANHDLLPHDEPDMEEMDGFLSTREPKTGPYLTNEPFNTRATGTPENAKVVHPLNDNDESEEMLNDSPHFAQVQSKSTVVPVTEVKNDFVSKELEMNISNDIGHATGVSSQSTPRVTHELDFSIEYEPEQSEIRPVTISSPLQTPESVTHQPISFNGGSQAPAQVQTTSGQSETVSTFASSPIVLPNPAPSIVNQSSETVAVVLQPDISPGGNVSDAANESNATANSNSTIAGIAVKTSVSVSLPLSKASNSSNNSTAVAATDEVLILPNASGVIVPVTIQLSKEEDGTLDTTLLPEPSTTSGGLKIRKPKLKIGGTDEPAAPRTRKPFLTPPQRSSTTVGPAVSIFKKSRTRMASITSSTTAKPFRQFSTIRIHYASRMPGMVPNGELEFSFQPVPITTTTVPTTTETEEPFSDEPFTDQTQGPIVPSEDDVTLIKVAGYVVVDKGLRWSEQLNNRHSPQYKEKANYVQMQLDRLFRTSPIASQLWKIQIDGFSGKRNSKSVVIDFFLYLIKSRNEISTEQLTSVFHEKLINNTFSRFTVDTAKTAFEFLNEEPMKPTTEAPETEPEPAIPQWAIAVIVVGAASLIFIVLFAAVAILGRHHMRRRYSSKLNDEDCDRPSEWESKMAAAYENLAADTIYDAEDLHSDTYKKRRNSTYHGQPSKPKRADSWSSSDWSPPPRRSRPQVHRIVY